MRTAGRRGNPAGRDAGGLQLENIGGLNVKIEFTRTAGRNEKAVWKSSGGEFAADILADFVAGRTDARPQRRPEPGWIRAEPGNEDFNGFLGDPGPGSPPAGVDRRNHPAAFVSQKKGETIGRFDHQEETCNGRDESVAVQSL